VDPALDGSYERLFHDAGMERFLLLLREGVIREALRDARLERAIGVIYRPESERLSHYFRARLPEQFATRCCTSIRPRRSNRWSDGRLTKLTCLKPIQPESEVSHGPRSDQ
jgi:hypothetical protein